MEPFFDEYLRTLEAIYGEFQRALDGLPVEAVNWVPGEGMNSLAVLATHTAGAQRYWIGDVAMGEPRERDRPAEFLVKDMSAEQALGRLNGSLLYAQGSLGQLTTSDLSVTRTAPRDGRTVTVSWALLHALEHTAMHAGHAQLTRQLWEGRGSGR